LSQPRRSAAVVFDLEFTSWEGSVARNWAQPNEEKEVVQIGAVKLRAQDLKILDSFEILVRPRFNSVLSDYFVQLTGITNDALAARAVDFITAYRSLLDFVGDASLWAFGRDDVVLAENLKLYGWKQDRTLPEYQNVIPWFAAQGIDLTGKHACDVAETVGAVFKGHKHDALADALGVATGIAKCVEGGAPNPFAPSGLMPAKRRANVPGKGGKRKKG
jgi:inhibitor of KinA sporulation pathway (predicted exonuclease)